jgi:hypothetical protein
MIVVNINVKLMLVMKMIRFAAPVVVLLDVCISFGPSIFVVEFFQS